MTERNIVHLGHPVLRSPAEAVLPEQLSGKTFQSLIDDMVEAMREAGGVGLAAPQVGEALQIFVYEVAGSEEAAEEDEIPLRVLVNPMVEPEVGELIYDWEGCLSIPGLRGLVPRHPQVRVHGLDREGRPQSFVAAGFEARIVQHEFDHLNGIVFLDRMRDLRSLTFEEEFARYVATAPGPQERATVG
ncbi:MAG: peptide deformylase [Acidobacteria bacterium]|nr:peptide deformylase [Acidobacteriota bacterium]